MDILIARPRLVLPRRVQREMDVEQAWSQWHTRFARALAASTAVAILNAASLGPALHGHGEWSVAPMMCSAIPLVWLLGWAAFPRYIYPPDADN